VASPEVRRALATGRLDAAVRVAFEMTGGAARRAVHSGKIRVNGQRSVDAGFLVREGAELVLDMAAPRPVRTEPLGVRLVYRDDHVLVVDKPSGLLSSPYPEEQGPSALDAALQLCRGVRVAKVVHRLDKLTSGLLIFARTVPAARALRESIDAHRARRTYHCVVQGVPVRTEATIVSDLVENRGDGYRGSLGGMRRILPVDAEVVLPEVGRGMESTGPGKIAVTRYRVMATAVKGPNKSDTSAAALATGRAALEVRIETGRTHQIRIHLAEIGHPVLGEQVYAHNDDAPRQALHAARLGFPHPFTGKWMEFFSPWPRDLWGVGPQGPDWGSTSG